MQLNPKSTRFRDSEPAQFISRDAERVISYIAAAEGFDAVTDIDPGFLPTQHTLLQLEIASMCHYEAKHSIVPGARGAARAQLLGLLRALDKQARKGKPADVAPLSYDPFAVTKREPLRAVK